MNVYVLNLDSAKDRWKAYEDKGWNRWKATHYDDLPDDHNDFAEFGDDSLKVLLKSIIK